MFFKKGREVIAFQEGTSKKVCFTVPYSNMCAVMLRRFLVQCLEEEDGNWKFIYKD